MWHFLPALAVSAVFLALCVRADPTYLECNGLSTRVKQGKTIMGAHPKQVNRSALPFKLFRYNTTGEWTNFSIVATAPPGKIEFIVQAIDNSTFTNFVHPNYGVCGNEPGDVNSQMCLKCSTQLYANTYSCTDKKGCLFGAKANGTPNMTVLIGWSTGEQGYGTGVVIYAPVDLATAPVIPPLPPPPLPACTDNAKDFCRGDSTGAWCCNFYYHGCVCTDYGDYNHIKSICDGCGKHQGIHCANKKGKCKYNGAIVNDCCPAAPQCKKNALP